MSSRDSKDPRTKFGNSLRTLRMKRGLSQEHLAESAHLHKNMVGLLERGLRNPSLVTIVKLAKALRVEPDKFFKNF
jgi:transcriptional regulator with XRE-family HTH domain